MKANQTIITRVAPSPTGLLHIGTARTALFNYLFTQKFGGTLILRIDDTDTERSTEEFERDIVNGLKNLRLSFDSFYRQSERSELYTDKINQLIRSGHAYISKEAQLKEGDRESVIRFKNPGGLVTFTDLILGTITVDVADLGDFIIAKSETEPLYHLASVIDDIDLNITHVIRGADHLSNTPRQILMLEALGAERPQYAHIPLILASDLSKMSKRHGAVSVKSYLEEGYLVETLLNFMALTGWSPQAAVTSEGITATNEEIFTLAELIERFSLEAVQAKGAVFNIEKLNWLNREYLKKLSDQELLAYFGAELGEGAHFTEPQLLILAKALTDKTSTKKEALDLLRSAEMAYLFNKPSVTLELIKNSAHVPRLIELLKTIPDADFIPETIKTAIWDFATEAGRGEVLWPMRTSLTGEAKSLDPFTVASLLGKQETVSRLETAARL